MNLEDLIELVVLLVIGGRWLRNLVGGFRRDAKKDDDEVLSPESSPGPEPAQASAQVSPDGFVEADDPAELAAAALEHLAALAQRGRLLVARVDRLHTEGGDDPAFPPIAAALSAMRSDLTQVLALMKRTQAEVESAPTPTVVADDSMAALELPLIVAQQRLLQLEPWWQQRQDPSDRQTLGDADALAQSLLAGLWEFLASRGIDIADPLPFCAFADHGLAYSLMFRGTGLAPLLLPRSYADDVAAWPILAHEVGHVLVANVPGLQAEVQALLGESLLVEQWSSEVFADGVGVLLLGPAFVTAAARDLASPDAPAEVLASPQDDYGQPTEHPPSHLRIRFMTALLDELGLHHEASEIWARWQFDHDEPDAVLLPRGDGSYGAYEMQPFLEGFTAAALAVSRESLVSLSEYRLTSVPGLVFSHAERHAVRDQAEALRVGLPRRADPRTVVSAAVVVGLEDGAPPAPVLAELVKQSIRGVGTGEGPRPDVHSRAPARARRVGRHVDRRTELIEALILTEAVLVPPVALRRRGPTSWPSSRRAR